MKKSLVVTMVLLSLCSFSIYAISQRGHVAVLEDRLVQLPLVLGPWRGEDRRFDDAVYKVLASDANILRRYTNKAGQVLWLYIGYYGTEKGGRTGHLPQYCYTGSGWDIEKLDRQTIDSASGTPVTVNKILVKNGVLQNLALYWIHSGENVVLDRGWKMNVHRLWRRITTNRDDGAFVRISAPVLENRTSEVLAYEKEFVALLLEELPRCWPLEKEITKKRSS